MIGGDVGTGNSLEKGRGAVDYGNPRPRHSGGVKEVDQLDAANSSWKIASMSSMFGATEWKWLLSQASHM